MLLLLKVVLSVIQLICLLLMSYSKDVNYTIKTGVIALIATIYIIGF